MTNSLTKAISFAKFIAVVVGCQFRSLTKERRRVCPSDIALMPERKRLSGPLASVLSLALKILPNGNRSDATMTTLAALTATTKSVKPRRL